MPQKKEFKNIARKNERLNIFTALLKLRQVCIHPNLLKELNGADIESSKFELAKEKILELVEEGHKIVMFSQFTEMLDIVQNGPNKNFTPNELMAVFPQKIEWPQWIDFKPMKILVCF